MQYTQADSKQRLERSGFDSRATEGERRGLGEVHQQWLERNEWSSRRPTKDDFILKENGVLFDDVYFVQRRLIEVHRPLFPIVALY